MISKGISHTSVQNPTYEFQKRNISSIQEIISSIQNYQGLSFLPVTFTGLAELFPQLGSWHWLLCGDFMYQHWWSRGKILTWDARGPEFKSRVLYLLHFQDDILGSLGSNLVSSFLLELCSSWQNTMNDFGIIKIKFENEFWLIPLCENISPKLFAVQDKHEWSLGCVPPTSEWAV